MSITNSIYRRLRSEWLRRTDYAGAPTFFDPAPVAGYRNARGEPDFIPNMLPWLDRSDADIDAYVRTLHELPHGYDLREKLRAWQRNGFVLFERAIDYRLIEAYRADLQELMQHHKDHDEVRVDHKLYNGAGGSVSIAQIAREHLNH